MRDVHFDWDDARAASNRVKHKVSFEQARIAFDDPKRIEIPHYDGDEERVLLVATASGRILAVVYTERGSRFRIISAREATKHEQNNYFTEAR